MDVDREEVEAVSRTVLIAKRAEYFEPTEKALPVDHIELVKARLLIRKLELNENI